MQYIPGVAEQEQCSLKIVEGSLVCDEVLRYMMLPCYNKDFLNML